GDHPPRPGRESSPTARDDRWLRADRPSLTRLPSAYRHRKIPADPSSPPRIKISRIRFAQVGGRSYFSRCPNDNASFPVYHRLSTVIFVSSKQYVEMFTIDT